MIDDGPHSRLTTAPGCSKIGNTMEERGAPAPMEKAPEGLARFIWYLIGIEARKGVGSLPADKDPWDMAGLDGRGGSCGRSGPLPNPCRYPTSSPLGTYRRRHSPALCCMCPSGIPLLRCAVAVPRRGGAPAFQAPGALLGTIGSAVSVEEGRLNGTRVRPRL